MVEGESAVVNTNCSLYSFRKGEVQAPVAYLILVRGRFPARSRNRVGAPSPTTDLGHVEKDYERQETASPAHRLCGVWVGVLLETKSHSSRCISN